MLCNDILLRPTNPLDRNRCKQNYLEGAKKKSEVNEQRPRNNDKKARYVCIYKGELKWKKSKQNEIRINRALWIELPTKFPQTYRETLVLENLMPYFDPKKSNTFNCVTMNEYQD